MHDNKEMEYHENLNTVHIKQQVAYCPSEARQRHHRVGAVFTRSPLRRDNISFHAHWCLATGIYLATDA